MADNNQNNPLTWKDRLHELDHLPGEAPFDKVNAWERLQARSGNKNRSRKLLFVALAVAASLLVAFLFLSPLTQPEKRAVAKQNPDTKNSSPVIRDTVISKPAEKNAMPPGYITGIQQKQESKKRMIVTDTIAEIRKDISSQPETAKNPEIQATVHVKDTAANVAVTPPVPRLRVVHINEISQGGNGEQWAKQSRTPRYNTIVPGTENYPVTARNESRIRFNPSN